jgi:hypothetical protein
MSHSTPIAPTSVAPMASGVVRGDDMGSGTSVAVGDEIAVGVVGVAEGVAVGVAVAVAVGVFVGVLVGVGRGVRVGVAVGVIVGVAVGVAVALTVGVTADVASTVTAAWPCVGWLSGGAPAATAPSTIR